MEKIDAEFSLTFLTFFSFSKIWTLSRFDKQYSIHNEMIILCYLTTYVKSCLNQITIIDLIVPVFGVSCQ